MRAGGNPVVSTIARNAGRRRRQGPPSVAFGGNTISSRIGWKPSG
jgi:hypothetical protein